MLVDDSATIRGVIKVFLAPLGVDFVEAESGERALQVLKLVPVDLIISDVRMPAMDGLELCRAIRTHAKTQLRTVPIVLLTSDKSDKVRQDGKLAGADDFALKPVADSEICEVVRRLLKKADTSRAGAV
jgi:two-component system chemotaxis response regulator CheY